MTIDGVAGIDSNRIVVEADASEDVFIHLWDFGNGQISHDPVDTMVYYVEGKYGISYQGHAPGGMAYFADSVTIEKTLELPCEGTLALLTGCDNPKSWKFAPDAGAIAIGPDRSTLWYASPADGSRFPRRQMVTRRCVCVRQQWQHDESIDGYVETPMTVLPPLTLLNCKPVPMGKIFLP